MLLTDLGAVLMLVLQQDAWWRREGVQARGYGFPQPRKAVPRVGVSGRGFPVPVLLQAKGARDHKGVQLPPTSFTCPPSPALPIHARV